MTVWTAAGIALVLFLIVGVGLFSGKRVKGASDFVDGGKKAGPFLVCGTIMGSLVSSQATVGTAQLGRLVVHPGGGNRMPDSWRDVRQTLKRQRLYH